MTIYIRGEGACGDREKVPLGVAVLVSAVVLLSRHLSNYIHVVGG
ncbi:hypothetical protein HSB1_09710 [Halogranum salarium B-1]|uniref:Uncharacterized protein n=1 Tax=Halogranum salarium B-1 TaxID=1210908 RepID=J3A4H4_9EURY|nr:hypothetical protein HSB1_09710 [Halogranum salarium B-1]